MPNSNTITYTQAQSALVHICGWKFENLLFNINKSNASERRRAILEDYSYNSLSLEGIECLNKVLIFINQQSKN